MSEKKNVKMIVVRACAHDGKVYQPGDAIASSEDKTVANLLLSGRVMTEELGTKFLKENPPKKKVAKKKAVKES